RLPQRSAPTFARQRIIGLASAARSQTTGFQRATRTGRIAARTYSRAQVHDRLGIVGHALPWRVAFGVRPECLVIGRRAGAHVDRRQSRDYAFGIAVENRRPLIVTLRDDGA